MEGGVYVINTLFKENGHLTKKSLKGIKEGTFSDNELVLLLEHICQCEECVVALADSYNNNELMQVPCGFEQETLIKIKNKKVKNTQFIFYSLRVAIAASIALIFVFSNPLNFVASTKVKTLGINPISFSYINTINSNLNKTSQNIINMEVFNDEKGKK